MKIDVRRLCGHRGVAAEAPENTLSSIRKVKPHGMEWVEIDVQLTADGVPVVFHDATLDRCTNGSGRLAAISLAELIRLDAGSYFAPNYQGERVPTLMQVMDQVLQDGLNLNIEIKVYRDTDIPALCDAIFGDIQASDLPFDKLLFSSFSLEALSYCYEHFPDIRRAILWEEIPDNWQEFRELASYSIHCDYSLLTEQKAREVKDSGFILKCYTPNDPNQVSEHWGWGVDMMITDSPLPYLE